MTGNRLDVKDVRQVPHMIKVTGFNFTPIHKFRPEKQTWSEQTPGTNSTELEVLGGQHYIDPLRPKSTKIMIIITIGLIFNNTHQLINILYL
jgi:hypothetical protein